MTHMLTPEQRDIVTRWVAALRSGQYEQGVDVLRDRDNRYCCLGVLCDLIDPSAWSERGSLFAWGLADPREDFPTDHVLDLAGATQEFAKRLAEDNDDGAPFVQIAAHIGRRLLGEV